MRPSQSIFGLFAIQCRCCNCTVQSNSLQILERKRCAHVHGSSTRYTNPPLPLCILFPVIRIQNTTRLLCLLTVRHTSATALPLKIRLQTIHQPCRLGRVLAPAPDTLAVLVEEDRERETRQRDETRHRGRPVHAEVVVHVCREQGEHGAECAAQDGVAG